MMSNQRKIKNKPIKKTKPTAAASKALETDDPLLY